MRSNNNCATVFAAGAAMMVSLCMLAVVSGMYPYSVGAATPTVDSISPGQLVFHEADETIAYNWFTYVPETISKTQLAHILVTGLHGNIITDDYQAITEESRRQAEWRTSLADLHKYILLVPVIPRPSTDHVYCVAFDWKVFLHSTPPFRQRPDVKVNSMIDQFVGDLRQAGYQVHDKVFVEGFSAGAMFAQRYALLHPERVRALAAGQCGGAMTLPESSYRGFSMDWPVGVSDFLPLVGYEFDRDAYQQVLQFIYIGDQDTTNSTLWGTGELWRTQSQIDFLNRTFGSTDPVRLESQVAYLNLAGYDNITFKMYSGVGHQYTGGMVTDYLAFFDAARATPTPTATTTATSTRTATPTTTWWLYLPIILKYI